MNKERTQFMTHRLDIAHTVMKDLENKYSTKEDRGPSYKLGMTMLAVFKKQVLGLQTSLETQGLLSSDELDLLEMIEQQTANTPKK